MPSGPLHAVVTLQLKLPSMRLVMRGMNGSSSITNTRISAIRAPVKRNEAPQQKPIMAVRQILGAAHA
jgi:hypothetical protein